MLASANRAPKSNDSSRIQKLVVAGLTVTVRLRILGSILDVAKLSIDASNIYQAKKELLSDSWTNWLQKFRIIYADLPASHTHEVKLKALKQRGVQCDRKDVNLTLLQASVKALPILLPGSYVLDLVQRINREFGKDTLGNGYTKIYRMILNSQKFVGALTKTPYHKLELVEGLVWQLECVLVCLQRQMYTPAFLSAANLSSEKENKIGWCELQFAKLTVLLHCQNYCAPLSGDMKRNLDAAQRLALKSISFSI